MEEMNYIHKVTERIDNTDYDEPNREVFVFRSTERYFDDLKADVKKAITYWVNSITTAHRKALIELIKQRYCIADYYDEQDPTIEDSDKITASPMNEASLTWHDVANYMPNDIQVKFGFSSEVTTENVVEEDENLNKSPCKYKIVIADVSENGTCFMLLTLHTNELVKSLKENFYEGYSITIYRDNSLIYQGTFDDNTINDFAVDIQDEK